MVNVVEVNLQSQRFEMSGDDAISFLTLDGFTVNVEGTIEFALMREKAALLTHEVGDMDDILKKVILPLARGFSRIEGSKNPAKNYIMGDTRQKFQDNLQAHLQQRCGEWGVAIKSVLIRNITPPDEIASIIRDREVAVQTAKKYEQQIEQAKSKAELTKQEMLAQQNKEKVEADTARIRAVIAAQQEQAVRITAANQELGVAKLENEAADFQAQAILLKAGADRAVIQMNNEAQAAVLANSGAGVRQRHELARYTFYQKIGPRISTILTSDQTRRTGRPLPALPAEGKGGGPMKSAIGLAIVFVLIVAGFWLIWQWGFCRFYVEPNEMAVITAKVGDELPPGQILGKKGQQGVQEDVLGEGRHFLNPILYERTILPVTIIPRRQGRGRYLEGRQGTAGRRIPRGARPEGHLAKRARAGQVPPESVWLHH